MSRSLAAAAMPAHPVLPDMPRKAMAKADVRNPDIAWNEQIGRALQAAVRDVEWTNKEAAARIGVDDAEFGKWLSGARRPQMDRVFAVAELQQPFVLRLCRLVGGRVTARVDFPDERTA